MATKKGSKTAHVLNVLSNPTKQDSEEGALEETSEGEVAQKTAPSRPVRVPILEVARANDDTLSEQIRGLLEEDLLREEEAAENQTSVIQAPSEAVGESIEEAQKEEIPEESTELPPEVSTAKVDFIQEAEVPTTPDKTTEVHEKSLASPEDDFSYVNIMQALVEEKCMRYINMFGLCTCSHCIADVKALALSNLPAKYLVMQRGEVIPMLTVYEGRFSSALTAQILTACKIVLENPRHKRA
jgi:hypothetical protein